MYSAVNAMKFNDHVFFKSEAWNTIEDLRGQHGRHRWGMRRYRAINCPIRTAHCNLARWLSEFEFKMALPRLPKFAYRCTWEDFTYREFITNLLCFTDNYLSMSHQDVAYSSCKGYLDRTAGQEYWMWFWNLFKQTASNRWVPPLLRYGNQYRISTS